jgi:hypothetical protein
MPTPHLPDGGQSALEVAAIAQRNTLIPINLYNGNQPANEYTATHTRAISDSLTPHNGKGSGQFLDIFNYDGVGSDWDQNGNPSNRNGQGSGRNPAFANNLSTWGYGPNSYYLAPDTSKNSGQVII